MHSKRERLRTRIREALHALDGEKCPDNKCEGCEVERQEAIRILKEALRG